jgi:hypothetical protein
MEGTTVKQARDFFIQAVHDGSLTLMYYGLPPRTDAEARAISLAKYQLVLEALERDPTLRVVAGGPSTCGLCMLHLARGCRSCPVYRKTGRIECRGTALERLVVATERGRGDPVQAARAVVAEIANLEVAG